LAPIIAGFLFTANLQLPTVAMIMSLGSLFAAGVLSLLKLSPERPNASAAEEDAHDDRARTDLKGAVAHGR
jgi:hypothetical protein